MATGAVKRNGMGIARGSCGSAVGDGTALSVTLGFKPKRVEIINTTDATKFELIDGMAVGQTLKTVTGGAQTVETGGIITLVEKGFILRAAEAANAKALVWFAQ